MGSGTKTKHQNYIVETAGTPESPIVVPVSESPFFATVWQLEEWGDVDAEVAEKWFDYGFGLGAHDAYQNEGISNPQTAKDFLDCGMGPADAAAWHNDGWDAAGAAAWKSNGFLPEEATAHLVNGLTPLQALVANAEAVGAGEKLNISLEVAGAEFPVAWINCEKCGTSYLADDPTANLSGCPNCDPALADDDEIVLDSEDHLIIESEDVQLHCPKCGAVWPEDLSMYQSKCPSCGEVPYPMLENVIADFNTPSQPESTQIVDLPALGELPVDAAPIEVAPTTSIPDAGHISDDTWLEAVTPVPDVVPLGDPRGVPLLIGGADLEKGSATIMSYSDGNKEAHEVLFCTINESAEQKLLEALAPTEEKLIPVESFKTVVGRIDADKEMQIFEDALAAAKSMNTHLKAQDAIPSHTLDRIKKLEAAMAGFAENNDPSVQEMAKHYKPVIDAMAAAIKPDYSTPYNDGGKIPMVTEFSTTWEQKVIEYVPDLSALTGTSLLATSARQASRVDPTIIDGVATWNGKSRSSAQGVEYVIQLPDGYAAVYHPYVYAGQKLQSDHFSLRGQLEIHCPGGEGHAKDLVDVLGSLNIVNRPMNGAEAEWAYLQENIKAQDIANNPAVTQAIASSQDLETAVEQEILFKHADEAMEMGEEELEKLAHKLTLEVEASVLPLRVRIVRDAVAKVTGFVSGQELAASPFYDPTPRKSGGWMVFDRFDVSRDESQLKKKFGKKGLRVSITGTGKHGASILDIFKNGGVLASTERRRIMGVAKGSGMSESSDMTSGGAKSTFARIFNKSHNSHGVSMIWDEPLKLLKRSDWYGANQDTFGSINKSSAYSAHASTTDPATVSGFSSSNNEIMFRDGLDLLGVDAPSRVICSNGAERDEVRKYLKSIGVNEIGGLPVDTVITNA